MKFKKQKKIKNTVPIPPVIDDIRHLEIEVRNNNFEDAFRQFKALIQKERLVGQIKERSRYEKPSVKKRRKRKEARDRIRIAEFREKMIASGQWDKIQKKKLKKQKDKEENEKKRQEEFETRGF